MWAVQLGAKATPILFKTDEEAERFMLRYLEDDLLCSIPEEERNKVRSDLNDAYQARTQLKEGWGVYPYLTAKFFEEKI